jgi:RNA polymerase sigma-70 factor (ECF subfamily)
MNDKPSPPEVSSGNQPSASRTRLSLLRRACDGEETAWRQVVALYQPLIRAWLVRQQVQPQEAEDLTQDVLAILVKGLPRFDHPGKPGAFRAWLRAITVNRAREFWRQGKCRALTPGGSAFLDQLDQLEDSASDGSRLWDEEHDQHVLRHLLTELEKDFEPATLQAFRRLTFDKASGREVAAELGMSRAAVYNAKSRVLQRLRETAAGLID